MSGGFMTAINIPVDPAFVHEIWKGAVAVGMSILAGAVLFLDGK